MKFLKVFSLSVSVLSTVILLNACKAKKPKPVAAAPVETETPAPAPAPAPKQEAPAAAPALAPVPEKPDYNFANIQFEFNSGILKTESYPRLDKAAAEMKKDASVKFVLNGHASAEGTDAHNMALSVERATSVKTYLVNSGVSADNLVVKGYGDKKPIADNSTEAGRVKNRRVEIKKL
ncbi:OmpA family protein [Mucilaginibacter ximonensis]|uniref:OmpA family protein n=1 Tax=Mucilaginibacter ximonensis TaxID=538021 RepID=A0ABW5YE23_9SPHI